MMMDQAEEAIGTLQHESGANSLGYLLAMR